MRPALLVATLVVPVAFGLTALAPAHAQDKTAKSAAARPAPGKTVVPADVRERVVGKLPGAKPEDVAGSPLPGLYEVSMGGHIVYVTADGKHLLSGDLYDLDTQTNLTATRRSAARAKALASAPEDQMIVFGPAGAEDDGHRLHRHRLRLLPAIPQPDRRYQQGGCARALHDVPAHRTGH